MDNMPEVTQVIALPTCAICRDDEDTEVNYVVTKCGHLFHGECMTEWSRNERNRGGNPRCPFCNTTLHSYNDYNDYGDRTSSMIRLHQLTKHRVTILEDGKPTPEQEIKAARDNLNTIKVILNTKTDKLRLTEAEKTKLEAENKLLKSTIDKLNKEIELQKQKVDTRAADLRKEKQSRQKDLATHLEEKQHFQKQIADAKYHYDRIRAERAELQKEMGRRQGENGKLRGIMTNQTNTISRLQAQSIQVNQEKADLVQKLTTAQRTNQTLVSQLQALVPNHQRYLNSIQAIQSNQHFYQAPSLEPAQSSQLADVLQGLSGGFMRLEKEYKGIKKLLEEKNKKDGNRGRLEDPVEQDRPIQVHVEDIQERSLSTSRATSLAPEPRLDLMKSEQSEIRELIQKVEALKLPHTPAVDQKITPAVDQVFTPAVDQMIAPAVDQMIDPRLFG